MDAIGGRATRVRPYPRQSGQLRAAFARQTEAGPFSLPGFPLWFLVAALFLPASRVQAGFNFGERANSSDWQVAHSNEYDLPVASAQ